MELPGVSPPKTPVELPRVTPPKNEVDDDILPLLLPIDYDIGDKYDYMDEDTYTSTQQHRRVVHP